MSTTSKDQEKRIVVLISGSGSNLQALLDAAGSSALPNAKITQVISNRKNAFGLERAQKHNVPTTVFNLKTWSNQTGRDRHHYDAVLARKVLLGGMGRSGDHVQGQEGGDESVSSEQQHQPQQIQHDSPPHFLPDLIVLAGFMHILSPAFLEIISSASKDKGREIPCINLHPALPGQFDGSQAIERAFKSFQDGTLKNDTTGAMVHKVVAEVDRGQPIIIEEIKLQKDETLESLKDKIHQVEHRIIVQGAKKVLEDSS